ncbi:MAG: antitoxin family protein [Acidobacteria bacterium]|nr:antitoxin family protein [Acidobacteriota bacterium]
MSITIEAIYESGVLRPLSPLTQLKENEKVRLTVEVVGAVKEGVSVIDQQRGSRIQIEPRIAREIGDSHEYDVIGS